ncbi:MAG TPA: alpha-amylase family glycosyl hydrolase [Flavisolibacter sp.]|nr:alpha-amylase family glycosyl hydrolase [Flavisolibacter sp.]
MRSTFLPLLAAVFFLTSCIDNKTNNASETSANSDSTATVDGHPAWIIQGNVYEVNVRQYTPQGTFQAFETSLQRLKDMGVQTLWFMPINPISKTDRKGALGSYYAVSDYDAINPEYGTMDDWKALVKKAHDMGLKVIIDWVPNHTGADHPWLTRHPDFFVQDSNTHKALSPFDWSDTRQLDYKNTEMQDSMIAAMKYWITNSDIDGFRCDVAWNVPGDFWKKCIAQLKEAKAGLFFLAEGDKPYLLQNGFDAFYPWEAFHTWVDVAAGKRKATALDSIKAKYDTAYPANAIPMYFTSNHDENSWNKADYGTMPGASHAPFAVLSQTYAHSVPLIYSGQEEPFLDSVSFFYKDTITFSKYQRAPFYKTLLNLRKNNAALAADASFKKLRTSNDAAMYAFEREKAGNKVLVILNLSKTPQNFTWQDQPSQAEWNNVFKGDKEPVNKGFGIEPWGYAVYVNK